MTLLLEIASWVLVLSGSLFLLIGGYGIIRLPDFYTRLHAAGIIDSLGMILILVGLMIPAGLSLISVKLALVIALLLFTGSTACHALARAAVHAEEKPANADGGGVSSKP
uniref:Putative multisubunit Na+/H+ antiporter, MnhG subunit n=1 Tax=Magnetococcus massalia (strain MO-1) TaxID=451514 RepID=A0A1S7LJT1_MAGMO|nr:Putative multisubunit Na+/H+ antiporter, MnhG subunit [Candidatus Magnetococcus massalia]